MPGWDNMTYVVTDSHNYFSFKTSCDVVYDLLLGLVFFDKVGESSI